MVLIVGWGGGDTKDLGEVAPATCPNCHNQVFLHDIRSQKQVSLYFVPLVPYGGNEYLACPICRQGLQIRPEQRGAVDQMRAATAVFRRGGVSEDRYRASVESFWQVLGVNPSGQQVVRPPTSIPAGAAAEAPGTGGSSAATPSLGKQLADLGALHADGVLTDDEFAEAKRRLLGT